MALTIALSDLCGLRPDKESWYVPYFPHYLDICTVVVSCGTCMDQLLDYQFDKIFPGCRHLDIHEWLMEKGVSLGGVPGVQYLYHNRCHTPM